MANRSIQLTVSLLQWKRVKNGLVLFLFDILEWLFLSIKENRGEVVVSPHYYPSLPPSHDCFLVVKMKTIICVWALNWKRWKDIGKSTTSISHNSPPSPNSEPIQPIHNIYLLIYLLYHTDFFSLFIEWENKWVSRRVGTLLIEYILQIKSTWSFIQRLG